MRARNSNNGSEPNINSACSNMENLDDLMRKKFNTADEAGRFEFQEQYWDQARALIEADERKRKRRRILIWWWLGGIFALSMASIFGIVYSKNIKNNNPDPSYTKVDAFNAPQYSEKPFSDQIDGRQIDHPKEKNENRLTERHASHAKAPSETGRKRSIKSTNSSKAQWPTAATNSNSHTDKVSKNVLSGIQKVADLTVQNIVNQNIRTDNNSDDNYNNINPASGMDTQINIAVAAHNNTEASPKEVTGDGDLNKMVVTAPALPSPAPPLGFWLLDEQTPTPQVPQVPMPPVKIQKKRNHNLAVFVSTAQTLSGGRKQGAALGIAYEGRLKHGLFYTGQLGWRYLPYAIGRDSFTIPASQQLRYSFGYQQNKTWFTAMNQHLLELPIGFGWRFKGIYVHGGLHTALRLATQATVWEETNTTLSPTPLAQTSKLWLEQAPLPQFWARPYAALGYGFGRLNMRVKAVWLPDFEARATDGQRQGTRGPMLDFGLGYSF